MVRIQHWAPKIMIFIKPKLTSSDLIQEAVTARYKEEAEKQRHQQNITRDAVRKLLGKKYAEAIQVIDGKCVLVGIEVFGEHIPTYDGWRYSLKVEGYGYINNLAEFGRFLERKYGQPIKE